MEEGRVHSTQFALVVLSPHLLTGDVTGDCIVDIFDLARVAAVIGNRAGPGIDPYADLNSDGRVTIIDLVTVASNLGKICT